MRFLKRASGFIWALVEWTLRAYSLYNENELCVITQGDAKVTDSDGPVFVIPVGFESVW